MRDSVKYDINELKKAIQWIEANSRDVFITVFSMREGELYFSCSDRQDNHVHITLYSDGQMMPKITKTEILK